MIQVIIGFICSVFGAALVLSTISAVINFFGKASIWLVFIIGAAIYAILFASTNSWLMFFPRLVGEFIFSALYGSSIIVMIYIIIKACTSRKFFLVFLAANWGLTALMFLIYNLN